MNNMTLSCGKIRRISAKALILLAAVCIYRPAADGLPGEYLVTNRWRALMSQYSPLTNPAFLTEANYVSSRLALSRTFAEFSIGELGVSVPIGLYHTVGISWLFLATDPFPKSGGDLGDFQTGAEIRDSKNFFMFSYAYNLWRRLSLGINVNLAYQNLYGEQQGAGVGVDAGLSYRLLRHAVLGDHVAGISMQNILAPTFSSNSPAEPDEQYSPALRFSLVSSYFEKRIESGIDFSIKDFYAQEGEQFKTVTDTGITGADDVIEWDLNFRLSVWFLRIFKLYGMIGFDGIQGIEYWGFAPGFNLPSLFVGHDVEFIYQFLSMIDGGATTNTWYLRFDAGKHREEIYARRMARLANIEPNELYNRALTLYSAGKYWDAFFVFGRIQVEYPDFFKRDWVAYYMGSCQKNLDMRKSALSRFEGAKTEFAKSIIVPYADLGMMRIFYRQGDFNGVAGQFRELNKPEIPDSLKYHAFYIMGQAEMRQGEPNKARQLLEAIPEFHPDFIFAQHSLGVEKVITTGLDAALTHFEKCVQAIPSTNAQKEVINRTLVLLGYLFYERAGEIDKALSSAVTALRRVPATSYYYDDALLGLGWTALRARQWQDCSDAGNALLKSKKMSIQAEGALLKAYVSMMQKDYITAANILGGKLGEIGAHKSISDDSISARELSYEDTRIRYHEVAEMANHLADNRQSSHILSKIDSTAAHQKIQKSEIDNYLLFSDDVKRTRFFERTLEAIVEDMEYALAMSKKMSSTRESVKEIEKLDTEQQQIDDEIRKLEEEMKQLHQEAE